MMRHDARVTRPKPCQAKYLLRKNEKQKSGLLRRAFWQFLTVCYDVSGNKKVSPERSPEMEKFYTRGLLTKFVTDQVSAKMLAENAHVIEFVEQQVAEFGLEKHTAFLERVFHGKQVSAEHFFKVLTRVEAAIAKKAGAKTAKKTSKKATKPVAKATKTATTAKTSRKQNAQKESVSSVAKLQAKIAKLVKVYNEKADDGQKVSVTMSYIVATLQ